MITQLRALLRTTRAGGPSKPQRHRRPQGARPCRREKAIVRGRQDGSQYSNCSNPERRMTALDGLGFLAVGLVLTTFCMKRLVPLRVTAIRSNLAFIVYGHVAGYRAGPGAPSDPVAGQFSAADASAVGRGIPTLERGVVSVVAAPI